jgi:hypothetical protein
MDIFFSVPGLSALGQPRLTSVLDEQGTPESGYEECGPYSCAKCIHKTASDEPFCIHPKVVGDTKLQSRLVQIDGRPAIKIDMDRGCCKFVNQPSVWDHDDDEEAEYEEAHE